MRAVDEGETFIVTRNGDPVGELRPLRRRRSVPAEATAALFKGAPSIDFSQLMDDLDSAADQIVALRAGQETCATGHP